MTLDSQKKALKRQYLKKRTSKKPYREVDQADVENNKEFTWNPLLDEILAKWYKKRTTEQVNRWYNQWTPNISCEMYDERENNA